jgi:hypothetical protein
MKDCPETIKMFKTLKRVLQKRKKIINAITPYSVFLSLMLMAIIGYLQIREASVAAEVTRYETKDLISYGGKLNNDSAIHADSLSLKGSFSNGVVLDIDIDTSDQIDYKNIGKAKEFAELRLKRLSKGGQCNFTILVIPKGNVIERFVVSWGKQGKIDIPVRQADEEMIRQIRRGINMSDFSQKARRDWIERNAKNLR